MLFNSLEFLLFFVAVLAAHWALPHRARTWFLLGASYVFYATWDWRFLALIGFSTLLDFFVGRVIGASRDPHTRKVALLTSLVGNLGLLGFFKYYGFFIDSLDELLAGFGMSATGLHLDIVLPLGISFYTFQTMSYAIDVYRGRMEPVQNLRDFALYVCFFPQLVAGPIERAGKLLPQIQSERSLRAVDLQEGMTLAIWGIFKKVVVADNMARVVDPIYALGASPSGSEVLIGTLAFTVQVYADFSSYSDIARGTARLLGFHLTQNFETPYFARDMGEFWRRWHITLSSWLRDYLYIPLGGSRSGKESRIALNLFLTLLLAGLWHGSDGTFIAFGAYHGALVVLARWYRQRAPVRPGSAAWPGAILSVLLFAIGLVFFRGQNLAQCLGLFGAVLSGLSWTPAMGPQVLQVAAGGLAIGIFDLLHRRAGTDLFVLRWSGPARVAAYALIFNLILLLGRAGGIEFVYFQF